MLYQGTTSVVPYQPSNNLGFSPCGECPLPRKFRAKARPAFSAPAHQHDRKQPGARHRIRAAMNEGQPERLDRLDAVVRLSPSRAATRQGPESSAPRVQIREHLTVESTEDDQCRKLRRIAVAGNCEQFVGVRQQVIRPAAILGKIHYKLPAPRINRSKQVSLRGIKKAIRTAARSKQRLALKCRRVIGDSQSVEQCRKNIHMAREVLNMARGKYSWLVKNHGSMHIDVVH